MNGRETERGINIEILVHLSREDSLVLNNVFLHSTPGHPLEVYRRFRAGEGLLSKM